jgi:hypothetical protein
VNVGREGCGLFTAAGADFNLAIDTFIGESLGDGSRSEWRTWRRR